MKGLYDMDDGQGAGPCASSSRHLSSRLAVHVVCMLPDACVDVRRRSRDMMSGSTQGG